MTDGNVIHGERVDLAEPFPVERLGEMHGWLRLSRTIREAPDFPAELDAFEAQMREDLPRIRSWAVHDRADGALVGVVMVEPAGLMGGRAYVASRRRAWGKGLLDEAAQLVTRLMFRENARVGYLFGLVAENNAPSKAFNERIGMRLKNVLPRHIRQGAELHDALVFEITREQWERDEWERELGL